VAGNVEREVSAFIRESIEEMRKLVGTVESEIRRAVEQFEETLRDLASKAPDTSPVTDTVSAAASSVSARAADVVETVKQQVPGKKPAAKKPAAAKQPAEKPAAKKPAAKKPAAKKPATKKPATKKPATKKPAATTAPAAESVPGTD
jgi:hypothetical protein